MAICELLRNAFDSLQNKDVLKAYIRFLEINSSIMLEVSKSLFFTNNTEYYQLLFEISDLCLSKCFEIFPKVMYHKDLLVINATSFYIDENPLFLLEEFETIKIPLSKICNILIELDYNILLQLKDATILKTNLLRIPKSLDDLTELCKDCRIFKTFVYRRNSIALVSTFLLKDCFELGDPSNVEAVLDIIDKCFVTSKHDDNSGDWSNYCKGLFFNLAKRNVLNSLLSETTYLAFKKGNYNLGINLLEGLCCSSSFRTYLSENSVHSEILNFLLRHCDLIGCKDEDLIKSYSVSDAPILLRSNATNNTPLELRLKILSEYSKIDQIPEHLLLNMTYLTPKVQQSYSSRDYLNLPTPYLNENVSCDHYSYELLEKSIASSK